MIYNPEIFNQVSFHWRNIMSVSTMLILRQIIILHLSMELEA